MSGSGERPSGDTDDRKEQLSFSTNGHNDKGGCSTDASPTAPVVNDNGKRRKVDENVSRSLISPEGLRLLFVVLCRDLLSSIVVTRQPSRQNLIVKVS